MASSTCCLFPSHSDIVPLEVYLSVYQLISTYKTITYGTWYDKLLFKEKKIINPTGETEGHRFAQIIADLTIVMETSVFSPHSNKK